MDNKRIWGSVIALSLIASITLIHVGKLEISDYFNNFKKNNKDMLKSSADGGSIDYTLDFNPSTNKFTNSETGAEITSTDLASMGVSYREVSGTDTIFLNNVKFITYSNEGIRIVDSGTYTSVNVVLQGKNVIHSAYEVGKTKFSGIGNDNGALYFSGSGSLDVSCIDNSEAYESMIGTETYAIHAATVTIDDAIINATVDGNKGFGVKCGNLEMNSGELNIKAYGKHNVAGINAGYGVEIAGGSVYVDVASNGGMAYGIIGGIQDATDDITITGGDVIVKVNGDIQDFETLKEVVKKYESDVNAKGATVADVVGYIDAVKQQVTEYNLKELQELINSNYTAGYTSFDKIKNAIVAVLERVGGKGFETSITKITGGAVDIEINGLHKHGIDVKSSSGEGLTVDNGASLKVHGIVDSCGVYGTDIFSTGITSEGSVQINEGKVDVILNSANMMSEGTTGLYMPANNFIMNTGADINIDVDCGFGVKFYGGNCHINDGRAIVRGSVVAYDGNTSSFDFIDTSGITGGTDVIAVANDYDGKERVKPEMSSNRWFYKYVHIGKIYEYSLYINSTGTVRQYNDTGTVIDSSRLAGWGMSVGTSAGVVQITLDNATFATKAADAIEVASNVKIISKAGTVNRISATSDGGIDSAVISAHNIETSGTGKLYLENRYVEYTSSLNSYKTCFGSEGNVTINETQIYLDGLDNCKTAYGINLEGNMIVNSGSIKVQGGYKTEYVKGAFHAGGVFTINAGDIEIGLTQSSYDESTDALSAAGLEFTEFNIYGGKINIYNHSTTGYTYGFYSNGSMTGYEYEQRGGVVRVYNTSDEEYDGYNGYTGGIDNCANIGIFDGYCEIEAQDLMSCTPDLTEGSYNAVSITLAKDEDGNEVPSPDIEDIEYFKYILIEPLYHYVYDGVEGMLYKNISGTYVEAEKNGWDVQRGSDGEYDLVLNGFHFSTADSGGILSGDSIFDIVLAEGSTNTIKYCYDLDKGSKTSAMAIYLSQIDESSKGIINISGDGVLNLEGEGVTTSTSKTTPIVGIWGKELNIEDATINTSLKGPSVYGTYIDDKMTVNNADLSYMVYLHTRLSTGQAMGMVAVDYEINDSNITVDGGNECVGIWSSEGINNINNSKVKVVVDYGGAIAGANETNIIDSDVTFIALDKDGASYGIYTREDMEQIINIEGSRVCMNIVGTLCMGIKASGDIYLLDSYIDMVFNDITTGAAGIYSFTREIVNHGKVYIDNCNIAISIAASRTTADNQGIASLYGSVDIYVSAIKIELNTGDGDGIQAGKHYSDTPSDYSGSVIQINIIGSNIYVVNNGKDLSEEIMGLCSSQGDLYIKGSIINTETTKASETGDVMGVMATDDVYITEGSMINAKVAPETNTFNYVTGIYSEEGRVTIEKTSQINTHVTGKYVNGVYGKNDIVIDGDAKIDIQVLDFTGVGMGVYSNAGTVTLDGIATGSVIYVKAKEGASGTSAGCLATMGAEIVTKDCYMTMDAYGEDGYAYAASDDVTIAGGNFTAKGSSGITSTDNVTYVNGSKSSASALATVVTKCSVDYKDAYVEDDLTAYPKASILKDKKYMEINEAPMYSYVYDGTNKKLYQVSYDGTDKVELVGSDIPTGLTIEDDKLKIKDFKFITSATAIINVDGDGTVYVEGTNFLGTTNGDEGNMYYGICGTGNLDITGTTTAELKINAYSHTSATGIGASNNLSISNINLKTNVTSTNGYGLMGANGKVVLNGVTADIIVKSKSGTLGTVDKIIGISANKGIDILNSVTKVRGDTSALDLYDISASNIKGSVKASEDANATTLSAVTDINTAYTGTLNKYKIFETEISTYIVTINWADLEYECEASNWNIDRGEFDNYTWKTVNTNGNIVTVVNDTADKAVYAKINYNPLEGYEDVTGEIRKSFDYTVITNSSVMVSPLDKLEAKLVLGGKLSSDATSTNLGEVTVSLSESAT